MTLGEKQILSRKLIFEALKKYRGLFNQKPNDADLELYADMLSGQFEFKQVTWALTEFVKKGTAFFPSCGEIFALLQIQKPTKEQEAPVIVAEMLQALRDYSQYDETRMLENVSDTARKAFQMLGSTLDIRLSEDTEIVRAQIERLVKGVLASGEISAKAETLQKIGIDVGVLSLPTSLGLRQINFTQDKP